MVIFESNEEGRLVEADTPGARRRRGPSTHKTAQTRAAVARAALELFLERGYRATRIDDVAQRAGVAKGTVYLHFADKQALFTGVISSVLEQRVDALTAARPNADESLRDFLSRVFTPLLAAVEDSPWSGLIRLVMTEGRQAPELADIYRQRVLEPVAGQIRHWARLAAERGELSGDPLQRSPLLLLSPAILATMWNRLYPDEPMSAATTFEGFLDLAFGPRPR
ncbi:MAG: TetR/AcrR family transcriptional regulator [Mycobacterium sp.]|nr:TetR/AcrR family transcriptional regulator [Mycobacterium sp.]